MLTLDPHYPLVTGINRGISKKLGSMEALSLIGGVQHVERTLKAMPGFARFMDGGAFHGAYGPRILAQLPAAVDKLRADPDSRQALMVIWDPLHDLFNPLPPRDLPCTALLQIFIRNGELILHTTMRSNDLWLGTPHDWIQFTQLQLAIAKSLDIPAGRYHHHAVSFHLYERDLDKVDGMHDPDDEPEFLDGIGYYGQPMTEIQLRARRLLARQPMGALSTIEQWHDHQQELIDLA